VPASRSDLRGLGCCTSWRSRWAGTTWDRRGSRAKPAAYSAASSAVEHALTRFWYSIRFLLVAVTGSLPTYRDFVTTERTSRFDDPGARRPSRGRWRRRREHQRATRPLRLSSGRSGRECRRPARLRRRWPIRPLPRAQLPRSAGRCLHPVAHASLRLERPPPIRSQELAPPLFGHVGGAPPARSEVFVLGMCSATAWSRATASFATWPR